VSIISIFYTAFSSSDDQIAGIENKSASDIRADVAGSRADVAENMAEKGAADTNTSDAASGNATDVNATDVNATDVNAADVNAADGALQPKESESNVTMLNLDQFAEEHPLDPAAGIILSQAIAGKNATINFVQVQPGFGQKLHYHEWHDEIVYIIRGEGFMTIDGENRSIKTSDLIYLPSKVIHNNSASGNETMEAITIYVPAFDGKDKIFV
jgi:mannose-6-phosphate isomerase-like protein (cupin superfamily)